MIKKETLQKHIDNNLSFRLIAQEENCSIRKIQYWMEKYNLKTNLPQSNRGNITNSVPTTSLTLNCYKCNKKIRRIQSEIRASKSGKHFCSRSCAASINNLGSCRNPRVEKTCNKCSKLYYRSSGHKSPLLCEVCSAAVKDKSEAIKNSSLRDYQVKGKHPSWKNAAIRNFARSWNKDLKGLPCQNCGYSKHIEFCHIKAISSFEKTALLKEVNSPDNILVLCRNCHWEFDNQELEEKDIPLRPTL
jgi:hypothetical protein